MKKNKNNWSKTWGSSFSWPTDSAPTTHVTNDREIHTLNPMMKANIPGIFNPHKPFSEWTAPISVHGEGIFPAVKGQNLQTGNRNHLLGFQTCESFV